MNIDQAIYILRNTAWLGSNDERDETEQAVEMVIDKLLSAEKSQLLEEGTTKDATYDSISRKDAIDAVEFGITYAKAIDVNTGESKELFKEGNDALKKAVERLKELPSAEGCKCPCEYREPCDYCHYDAYRGHGCPAEEGLRDE